jgi:hypothetical protein
LEAQKGLDIFRSDDEEERRTSCNVQVMHTYNCYLMMASQLHYLSMSAAVPTLPAPPVL